MIQIDIFIVKSSASVFQKYAYTDALTPKEIERFNVTFIFSHRETKRNPSSSAGELLLPAEKGCHNFELLGG